MEKTQLKAFVRQAKSGNAEAFGKLYAQYATELYRFALWYLHSEADAEDAVQDACIKAFTQFKDLKNENSFKSWFFKILANVCKDKLAHSSKSLNIVSLDSPDSYLDPADPLSQSFVTSTELQDIIATLSPEDRSIVLLSCIGGFTGKEIGSALGMNGSTVRSRLSRSLARLREQLN